MITFMENKLVRCAHCGVIDGLDIDFVKYETETPFFISCPVCRNMGPMSPTPTDAMLNWNEEQKRIEKQLAFEYASLN